MHISSSYAKILGQKLFRTWELPRSGSKAKNGEKKKERERERKRERLNNEKNNGQLRVPNATSCGARKAAWAKILQGLGVGPGSAADRWL